MKFLKYTFIITALTVALFSCDKEETPDIGTAIPKITSIIATPDTIDFGGAFTTIVCTATGGGLSYLWDVDLGDIIPTDEKGVVQYSGSSCCVGLKEIKCTVTNSLGTVEETVNVFIREPNK